jgi:polyisoprenyl-phosphate glycosyltransferase
MKRISIVTPCYNEKENIEILHAQIDEVMSNLTEYEFEHIIIDNASTDGTVAILRDLAAKDKRVKIVLNNRNFGHIRSPYYGLKQAYGDAVIMMASDLQDPPSLIPQFIHKWEEGFKVVLGVKTHSEETPIFYALRTLYYRTLHALSEAPLVEHATGFGLYDQVVIKMLRTIVDPYPYFRGLIVELGYERAIIAYDQPKRVRGLTKNNFYTLFDMAMLGMTNHSRVPLRLATMLGFGAALLSFIIGVFYLVYKLLNWNSFSLGSAPVIIGLFFFGAIQLFFLGIVGEYIGALYTQVLNRPLVVEKERINFDH